MKGDILEDPANEPKKDMYMMSVDPEDAPDQPEYVYLPLNDFHVFYIQLTTFYALDSCRYVEIGIVSGIPVSVNGKNLSPASLLSELNEIGGKHGIGRIDMVENRIVGMKSRGVYETPGGTILFNAVRELESLTLDRETIQVKDSLALKYAELVYAGRWFDPLRESMQWRSHSGPAGASAQTGIFTPNYYFILLLFIFIIDIFYSLFFI